MHSDGSFPAFIEQKISIMDNGSPSPYVLLAGGERRTEGHRPTPESVPAPEQKSLKDRLRSMLGLKLADEVVVN
jgi:hypothetical protein